MSNARTLALKIDTRELDTLRDRLGEMTGEEIGRATVTALNGVVDRAYELSRERMNAGINLSDEYLRRRMRVEHATKGKPVASITASGARDDLTVLSRFDAKPVLVPNKTKLNAGMVGARRGIAPPGQKQAGVKVAVTRGNEDFIERGFMLPLNKGKERGGNGYGVFARSRDGTLKHRYGPSVYQLFAYQAQTVSYAAEEDLEATLIEQVTEVLQKVTP